MRKELVWKLVLIGVILIGSVFLIYSPTGIYNWLVKGGRAPDSNIKLGLDLRGGMHIVMKVHTEDAIKIAADQEMARLEERLKRDAVTYKSIQGTGVGQILVDGVDPKDESTITKILKDEFADWKYSTAPGRVTLNMRPETMAKTREDAITQAVETIRNRVNQFGVAEPSVQRQGLTSAESNDQLIVQLPGVDDPQRVKDLIKVTAVLELKLVEKGPMSSREALLADSNGVEPPGTEVLVGKPEVGERAIGPEYYLVRKAAEVTGRDLRTARRSVDQWNQPAVSFTLTPDGGTKFARVTGDNVGRHLAIVLDRQVTSAPNIKSRIEDEGIIEGNFTVEKADDLALVLKSGSLPAGLEFLEERTVGPSLGLDSIKQGLRASLAAVVGVLIFLLFYYRMAGVNATVALVFNIIILLGCMAYFRATLTLPGIAGVILGLGMAVDANVLVFERIREELRNGKAVRSAVSAGFGKAFWTIFDTNLTTVISAALLFNFGSGPVKGYAVTLIIGIAASMFTAIYVSRALFEVTFGNRTKIEKLSI